MTGHAEIAALVDQAARPLPLLWPLTTAVAANPLWDLRDKSFPQAVEIVRAVLGAEGVPTAEFFADALRKGRITEADVAAIGERGCRDPAGGGEPGPAARRLGTVAEIHDREHGTAIAASTDAEVARWCSAYLAGGLPAERGFYPVWASHVAPLSARRLRLPGLLRPAGSAPDCIATSLERLGLAVEEDMMIELTGQLARLPGWAAHAKWCSRWASPDHPGPALHLIDYLAVRLAYDAAALPHRQRPGPPARSASGGGRMIPADRKQRWRYQAAYEINYRNQLLSDLSRRHPSGATAAASARGAQSASPLAQVVCCIDARSEGLRRHLEALGGYQTLGFAGFFGIPARLHAWDRHQPADLLPVLLTPQLEIRQQPEQADAPGRGIAQRAFSDRQELDAATDALQAARSDPVGSYLAAEASGFLLGPIAAVKTLAPGRYSDLRERIRRRVDRTAEIPTEIVLHGPEAPSDEDQARLAETALRTMGLTDGFAPVIVLCGHRSQSDNNPYASSLDCGACGAAPGGTSARIAAALFNRPAVRALLSARDIHIPAATVFVAAEHNTTTDTVRIFDTHCLPRRHQERVARIAADLEQAGRASAAERLRLLPGVSRPSARHAHSRATDWAQTQPEWGLAGNAAFVIAPRSLTSGIDLKGRCFLHSYQPDADHDGTILETILTGPMIVAQWINACYYFSVVDPDIFGAGDKTAHNVVAGVAVHQGVAGDLKLGLPRQSVFDGDKPFHEPMRLLVLVDAGTDLIDAVIDRNPILQQLTDGEWIALAAHRHRHWKIRQPDRSWQDWLQRERQSA